MIAGALKLIGSDALYGRNWGAIEQHQFLHFELCYYQAIDFAIPRGLPASRRRTGAAQAGARLCAGQDLEPAFPAHPGLSRAVAEYLAQERQAIAHDRDMLARHSPFRQETDD